MTAPEADSLDLELVVPDRVPAGEPVPFTLRLRNRTARALDLYLRGRTITFDVEVARPDGAVVWRRLDDEVIPAIALLRTLAPGERLEVEAAGEPLEPGEYSARGLLLTEGSPLETPWVPLRVLARGD